MGDQPRQTILVVRERRPLVRINSRDARRKVTRERKVTEKPLVLASTGARALYRANCHHLGGSARLRSVTFTGKFGAAIPRYK